MKNNQKKRAVLLIGHGSRSSDSRRVLSYHTKKIEKMGLFDEVHVCFLQSDPMINEVFPKIDVEVVFVVPLFIAHGIHTLKDIPAAIGISGNHGIVGGKEVFYCEPLGTSDLITKVILDRIEEAERTMSAQKL